MQLLIEITPQFISAFEWDGNDVQLVGTESCTVRTDIGYTESLRALIQKIAAPERFDQISCSYVNDAFTLVPSSLFDTKNAFELLQFTSSAAITKNETDYNRLPEWNCVAIYHLPLWIKSVLILKFPRIQIQHEMTHLLRGISTGSILSLKTIIVIHSSTCSIVIRKNGQILHASMQDVQAVEDITYQLMVCFQRLALTEKGQFIVSYSTIDEQTMAEKLADQLATLQAFEQQTIELKSNFHLEIQKLCV